MAGWNKLDGYRILADHAISFEDVLHVSAKEKIGGTMRLSLLVALLLPVLVSCAGPHASGTYQTSASYDRLYSASLAAVPVMGYTVTTSNKADGLIVAQQGVVMGHGSTVGLNISVSNSGPARLLQVNFMGPPGTVAMGDFNTNVAEYADAVRSRVPDLRQQR